MQNSIKYSFFTIVILVTGTVGCFGQISPGKLAGSHAHLEGLSNCTKCHVLGERVSNEKCLDCHKEVASRINLNSGYHSSPEVKGKNCVQCHSDHHGREFQMIHFDSNDFDHARTGYMLQGTHARMICGDCHKSEFIADPRVRRRSNTYMGLDRNCLSCHTDSHQGTLSRDCSSCHDYESFKPASNFDHRNTRFRLRGKHSSADCNKCHKMKDFHGTDIREFSGVPFNNCTSCHEDIHENKFGQNCVQCHSEESFKSIKQLNNFNHSLTDYALDGKHRFVSCAKCHKTDYTETISFSHCSDCHNDYHDNQFVHQGKSPDCSDCHSTEGFNRTLFSVSRHNETSFKLSGAHLATPCFACHKKTNKWKFREIGTMCDDCHENIHDTYINKKFYEGEICQSCHNNNRWNEIDFDHSKTNYQLEGAHARQSCRSCHFKPGESGIVHQKFSGLSEGCNNCHQDAHFGQFDEPGDTYCLKCHDYDNWSPGRFNHDETEFRLDGQHKNVACNKCHIPVVTAEATFTLYKLKEFKCESCH